jgi:flagellar biosynthesis/type III secretory pathway protein FliH
MRAQLHEPEMTPAVHAAPEPLSCVVESELGRLEVGLAAQLDTLRDSLVAAASSSEAHG